MTKQELIEELKNERAIATGIYKRRFEDFTLDKPSTWHWETGSVAGQVDILQYVLERLEELE